MSNDPADVKVVTLTEAARSLGLSPSTLRHQARSGRLYVWRFGRDLVLKQSEVERYRRESLRKKAE